MEEHFTLTVTDGGQLHDFDARLVATGYAYRFIVCIGSVDITFEPDEERSLRALVQPSDIAGNKLITPQLLQSIADRLQEIISA